MWRSFFMALGIFLMIMGGQALVVDQVVMASSRRIPAMLDSRNSVNVVGQPYSGTDRTFPSLGTQNGGGLFRSAGYSNYSNTQDYLRSKRVIQTRDWMPWSLLAVGAMIVLYTYSLPSKGGE